MQYDRSTNIETKSIVSNRHLIFHHLESLTSGMRAFNNSTRTAYTHFSVFTLERTITIYMQVNMRMYFIKFDRFSLFYVRAAQNG